MEIRNNAEALKAFLGSPTSETSKIRQRQNGESAARQLVLTGDQATLSQAGTEVALSFAEGGVRAEKVAAIQLAIAAGTYKVPASDVAGKVLDAMIAGGILSGK